MFVDLLSSVGSLFIIMMMGVYLRRRKIAGEYFAKQFAELITTVVLPCAIIKYMSPEISQEQISIGIHMLILGAAVGIATFAIGYVLYRASGRTALGRIMWAGTTGTNLALFGYPVVESLFGNEGMFYYNIMLIPIRIIIYTMLSRVLVSDEKRGEFKKHRVKSLCSSPLLYLVIGIAIGYFHIQLPRLISLTIGTVSAALTPMGMILCGFTIADVEWSGLFSNKWVYIFSFAKFVLCPLAAVLIAVVSRANYMQSQLLILFASFPISSVVNAYAVKNDCAPVQSSAFTALTTLLALFVVPFAILISSNLFNS